MPEANPELTETIEADTVRQYFTDLFGEFKKRASNNQEGSPETRIIVETIKRNFQRDEVGIAVYENSHDIEDEKIPDRVIQLDENIPPRYFVTVTEEELNQTDLSKLPKEEVDSRMRRFVQNIHQITKQADVQTKIIK